MKRVSTSYAQTDVSFLLKDINGLVQALDTQEREKYIQQGMHYSEMLPVEHKPSKVYMDTYKEALNTLSYKTALATAKVADRIYNKHGEGVVLVSLARAGTPIGIIIKRFLKFKYGIDVPHYSISIIRGKGIDINAMDYIVDKHEAAKVQFVDGWIGKGAICSVLEEACKKLKALDNKYRAISPELATLSDPAGMTQMYGTREDFLIPSACLNATVSGLVSRTFLKEGIIGEKDFHGAAYYGNLVGEDQSNQFIDAICIHFEKIILMNDTYEEYTDCVSYKTGIDEVFKISEDFGIKDINKIKPGVGETTRVLLRRVPWKVLIRDLSDTTYLTHILTLCQEKNIEVVEYPLQMYRVCGLIKDMSADL